MDEEIIDLGCGPNKAPGSFGVDYHPYEGVDLVTDLEETPWPLDSDRYSTIIGRHIIEHVADPLAFMSEIHRIGKPNAQVCIYTPHFTSVNSYLDPTHRRHLSVRWYKLFTDQGYLSNHTGLFEVEYSRVTFGKSMRCWISKAQVRLLGVDRWEKHFAFAWPARDVVTALRIVK